MGGNQSKSGEEGGVKNGDENNNNNNDHNMDQVYNHSSNYSLGSNYSLTEQQPVQQQQNNNNSGMSSDPIRPELLLAEIKGEIAENDYFARSQKILQNIHIENIDIKYNIQDAIELDDAYLLAEPGYLSLENGIVRKPDGSLYIALFIDLGYDINGDMFDWWFCNCDNNEQFRWIHPNNHLSGTWDPAYYSMMNFERPRGHYIDHIQITQQYLPNFTSGYDKSFDTTHNANNLYSIQTEFVRPSKFFDTSKFEDNNITCCIIGKINIKDSFFQTYIHIGYVFYIIREINGRSELRIRYWLGDFFYYLENSENYYYSQFIHLLTNNYLFRSMKLPINMGKIIYKNCLEEMLCLKEILPHYYKITLQQQREFQLTYSFTN